MNVLVTGGNGFIARNLKRLMTPMGYTIYAPSHSELDITNDIKLFSFVREKSIDVIIHTAARSLKPGSYDIDYEGFKNNIRMFESIKTANHDRNILVIHIGSGAEFDRREPIAEANEQLLWTRWPVDLYGLSKNIVSRRVLEEIPSGCVLRLFGCFGEDDNEDRFIKKSILLLKKGFPIQLHSTRIIDFFYIDDVAIVIDNLLKNGGIDNMNLVYPEKISLETIARFIQEEMKIEREITYSECNESYLPTYTGDASSLKNTGLKLIGLKEGIRRMVGALA